MGEETIEAKQASDVKINALSILTNYLTSTTTHGLRAVAEAHSILNRLFRIICFLGALGAFLYFIIKTGQQYLAYSSQIDIEIRNEYNMIFPAVTVCSGNPFRLDTTNASLIAYAKRNGLNVTKFDGEPFFDALVVETLVVDLFNRNETEELINIGFKLNDILLSCSFNGINCANNFTYSLSSVFGNCYTFNWKGTTENLFRVGQTAEFYSPFDGLAMSFYIPREYYYPVTTYDEGLILLLHDNDEFPLAVYNGIRLQPGLSHTVSFSKSERNFLGKPYTNCTSSVGKDVRGLYDVTFGTKSAGNLTYSEMVCQELCLKFITADACSCILSTSFFLRDVWFVHNDTLKAMNICVPASNEEVCAHAILQYMKTDNEMLTQLCPHCTPECKRVNYQTMASALSAPSKIQKQILAELILNNISSSSSYILVPDDFATKWDTYLDKNYLKVLVTDSTQYVTIYNQNAKMTIVDTFSGIGGQAGM